MQVLEYLGVFLCVKRAPVKIPVHSKAVERATRCEADNHACVEPSSSKDGEALQKFL